MSNELGFPLRIYENDPDDIILMVPHDPSTSWIYTLNGLCSVSEAAEYTKRTRRFCNWLRKQFPDVPTEFRYVNKTRVPDYRYRRSIWGGPSRHKTVNSDKHFVAYGLTRQQMLMIKLAWVFETHVVKIKNGIDTESADFLLDKVIVPSAELKKRMANPKRKIKMLDV